MRDQFGCPSDALSPSLLSLFQHSLLVLITHILHADVLLCDEFLSTLISTYTLCDGARLILIQVFNTSLVHVVECRGFESHPMQLIFLGKVTTLGVLCCFALLFV